MIEPSKRVQEFSDSIFGVMSRMANENNAINLSQGFPNFDGPEFVKDFVTKHIKEGRNQYAPFPGTPNLREQVSGYYKRFYDLDYSAASEVSISCGATEGIFLSILSTVNPGDEVIVFEPFYDSYVSSIKVAGGIPVPVTLSAPDFSINADELEKAITNKTKLLIFNNPQNPTGRVYSKDELQILVDAANKHDLMVISDEVYEFLTFDDLKHYPLATFNGMKERTLTISSAGKTFGFTGWKIGWVCAPENISDGIRKLHQYITFSVSTPMQEGVADALKELDSYIPEFRKEYQNKRDIFYKGITELGFELPKTQGTYFMMCPIHQKTNKTDVEYAKELILKKPGSSNTTFCFLSKVR
jgi:aspartate/methionine/tyrosine aminotransferase